jgi:type II secretory pathway component PulF
MTKLLENLHLAMVTGVVLTLIIAVVGPMLANAGAQ